MKNSKQIIDVGVLNVGIGNIGSVINMLKRIGVRARSIESHQGFAGVTHIILPGVGAFDEGMKSLESSGIKNALCECVLEKKVPTLGICLGMQMMTHGSEEGSKPGLGWIAASASRFIFDENQKVKIPHMGWNNVSVLRDNVLVQKATEDARFYFVHSYAVQCDDEDNVLMRTNYCGQSFVSAFQSSNIAGVQFHPEKSHRFGMQLLRGFLGEVPNCTAE